ncbi:MAG TPA: PilN domain-containing protein [Planctomycetota bacterium]|nr:PilN domain-containing protein [Planctomycetota bacterium]
MLTAIELGPKSLTTVTVKMNGRGPEIVQSGIADLASHDAEAIRVALGKTGVTGTKGVLVITRGQALLRDLELPAGTSDELVAMVRFQVEREMPVPLDQVHYSYIETGRSDGKVRIQVIAVPREVLDPAVSSVEAAGIKIVGAYVSSFGLLSLYGGTDPATLVEVASGEAEILVTDRGRMEFSRTAVLDEGLQAGQIAQEIRRTLLSYGSRAGHPEAGRIILAGEGPEASALAGAVGQALDRSVTLVGPGSLETATAAGVCVGLLRGASMPDLLHPPVAVRKFTLTRNHRILGLAGLVVAMLFIWSQTALSSKRAELDRKRQQLDALKPRATALMRTQAQAQLANQWYRTRNCWIDVLSALRSNVNTNSLWIVNASFEDPGVIRLQGKARDDSSVTDFVTALKKTGKFGTIAIERVDSNKSDTTTYRKDFTVNAQLTGVDTKKKKA